MRAWTNISKPINKELLRATIVRWVSGRESRHSAQNSGEVDTLDNGGGENGGGSLDFEILAQLKSIQRSGGPDIVAELLSVFAKDIPARFSSIRGSLTGNDADALEKAAHRLKGSSSQLGLVRVASLSASLERKGKEGNLDGAEALMDDLEKEYRHVETLIASKPWESL